MSPDSKFKIQFSKPFLPLPFGVTPVPEKTTEAKRSLNTFKFEDAVSLEIEGVKDFDVDKSIS